jgi:hypothetical protein
MSKKHKIELTQVEIGHLLTLIDNNKDEGWYYGPKEQYWNRSKRIEDQLRLIVRQNEK